VRRGERAGEPAGPGAGRATGAGQDHEPRTAQAAVLGDRLHGALAVVAPGRAPGGQDDHRGARGGRRADQLAGDAGRSAGARRARIAGRRDDFDERGRPALEQRHVGAHRTAVRTLDLHPDELAAERREERLERPRTPVGDGAEVGRHEAGALEPATDPSRDLGGPEAPGKRGRRHQHGALGDGDARHGGILAPLAHARAASVCPARVVRATIERLLRVNPDVRPATARVPHWLRLEQPEHDRGHALGSR
jgi:hypothetical protein